MPFPPSRVPVPGGPAEPLKVPTPAPAAAPLQLAPSHTNAMYGAVVSGLRKVWKPVWRRNSRHHSAQAPPPADVENAAGFSGMPVPELAPDYREVEPTPGPVTVHVAQDGHTFVPVPDDGPRSPDRLATPSMIMSPASLAGPTSNFAQSRHTSRAPSMHAPSVRIELVDSLPPGTHSGYHSRTSSMARNNEPERRSHTSRGAPGDSDSDDGDGEVATAVGHGGVDGISVLPPQSQAPTATPYARPHFINGTTDPRSTIEDIDSMAKAPPKRSPYGSTFAAIANAIEHVRSLPWVAQIVTAEWTPPNKRVGPPSQSQSWYTPGPRSGVFPGPPSGYPPEMAMGGYVPPPLTTTMNLSPGMLQQPPQAYSMSPDGSPWPPGTQYYYNPQYQPQPFVSPAPPPPQAHPHMPAVASPPQSHLLSPNDVPSLLLRHSGLQQPLSSQSMYPTSQSYQNRSAVSLPRRSRAASSTYGHAQ
ncbi:hypothetical protein AURDEDRAFT_181901 [Auricularia subglabra TFB-10046 SS5]|nr:hypothetical protein AURDEDRAFT_181901 [Auricularia subglabra TFB-10046 SS5]